MRLDYKRGHFSCVSFILVLEALAKFFIFKVRTNYNKNRDYEWKRLRKRKIQLLWERKRW